MLLSNSTRAKPALYISWTRSLSAHVHLANGTVKRLKIDSNLKGYIAPGKVKV